MRTITAVRVLAVAGAAFMLFAGVSVASADPDTEACVTLPTGQCINPSDVPVDKVIDYCKQVADPGDCRSRIPDRGGNPTDPPVITDPPGSPDDGNDNGSGGPRTGAVDQVPVGGVATGGGPLLKAWR